MSFALYDLVRNNVAFLFQSFLFTFPIARNVIQIRGLHSGFHTDITDAPNRAIFKGSVDLCECHDAESKYKNRDQTNYETLRFHSFLQV